MNRTSIEWVRNPDGTQGFTWNPMTGCKTGCGYCYARRIAERFGGKGAFEPQFYPERMGEPSGRVKPSTIFVGSMTDVFGPWWTRPQRGELEMAMLDAERHTYLLLTKWPQNIGTARDNRWWIGTSIDRAENDRRLLELSFADVGFRYVSFEPLLTRMSDRVIDWIGDHFLDWIIIGAQTGPGAVKCEMAWVQEIIDAADVAHVPVFVKDNLIQHYPALAGRRALPYLAEESF